MELGNLLFGNSRGSFSIPRDFVNTEEWQKLLDLCNVDFYGHCTSLENSQFYDKKTQGFKCMLFEIHPYYWGDCDCGRDDEEDIENHLASCSLRRHNFVYHQKNGDVTIDWYKYPFRDSWSNVELSEETFKNILKECISYIENIQK